MQISWIGYYISFSHAHRQALAGEVFFDAGDGVFAEVKDAGGKDGVGFAFGEHGHHVVQIPGAAAGDDGDSHGFTDGTGEGHVIAVFGAVGVHAGEENLTRPAAADLGGPGDDVEAGGIAASVGIDLPGAITIGAGIDGDHDGLVAESGGSVVDDLGVLDRGGIQTDLVGPGEEQGTHVGHGPDSPADREGHEAAGGGALHDVKDGAAAIGGGGDVEEDQFVGPLIVISDGGLHGIAGIAEFEEFGAFDDTALIHVEAGDDAAGQHGCFTGEDL